MFSAANDCTVRKWDMETGICDNIYKFANPISVLFINEDLNYMYTAHWDKMVKVTDLERGLVVKTFVASKETIKDILVIDDWVIVAGCDPVIRSFNIQDGEK